MEKSVGKKVLSKKSLCAVIRIGKWIVDSTYSKHLNKGIEKSSSCLTNLPLLKSAKKNLKNNNNN